MAQRYTDKPFITSLKVVDKYTYLGSTVSNNFSLNVEKQQFHRQGSYMAWEAQHMSLVQQTLDV